MNYLLDFILSSAEARLPAVNPVFERLLTQLLHSTAKAQSAEVAFSLQKAKSFARALQREKYCLSASDIDTLLERLTPHPGLFKAVLEHFLQNEYTRDSVLELYKQSSHYFLGKLFLFYKNQEELNKIFNLLLIDFREENFIHRIISLSQQHGAEFLQYLWSQGLINKEVYLQDAQNFIYLDLDNTHFILTQLNDKSKRFKKFLKSYLPVASNYIELFLQIARDNDINFSVSEIVHLERCKKNRHLPLLYELVKESDLKQLIFLIDQKFLPEQSLEYIKKANIRQTLASVQEQYSIDNELRLQAALEFLKTQQLEEKFEEFLALKNKKNKINKI